MLASVYIVCPYCICVVDKEPDHRQLDICQDNTIKCEECGEEFICFPEPEMKYYSSKIE